MTAPVSFRISTYWKRPRDEAGLTQLDSRRMSIGEALDWVLRELPDEAVTITPDVEGGHDAVTLRIDWSRVPDEIRAGA
jgi:hypothetical protein